MAVSRKLMIVTDLPFWCGSTGAQQRVLSLAKYLISQGFQLSVFYMLQRSALDREAGARLGIKVIGYVPSGRPSLTSLATWLG
ncbi:MAG TPA: hypothetical protein PKA83_15885, partial [Pirellulaceae bacterium]|nr:hypothetical protein [Pirellulaceae bacterium]